MELNFSHKNDDEDELELKSGNDKEVSKQEFDEGVEDDKGEALKYEEEQKDFQMKKTIQSKQTAGRSKLQ